MVLAGKFRAREVTEIEGFDSARFNMGVSEGFLPSCYGQRAQILVWKCSEGGFARSNYRNLSQYAHFVLLKTIL